LQTEKVLSIEFLGAAKTVTGSRTRITYGGKNFLVDCGLFQGPSKIRQKNWQEFSEPENLSALILTHAHIDHTGYIPKIVKEGFSAPIYCSAATAELCRIMLLDSAHLQEEDAYFINKRGKSKHKPALPLYTERDAQKALEYFKPVKKKEWIELTPGLSFRLIRSGHILGSTFVQLSYEVGNGVRLLTFSGDLGNDRQRVIKGPEQILETDYLVLESTYGDRIHPKEDVKSELADIINKTYDRGGVVVIPAFAVGRTQELLYIIRVLEEEGKIPQVPVYVDSPMANDSTDIYLKFPDELRLHVENGKMERPLCSHCFKEVRSADDSMMLCMKDGPFIDISAAGMLTGGRILHHLKARLPDPRNSLVFVGYQAEETKGRLLQKGLPKIRIHKEVVDVEAKIYTISSLSAHADSQQIIDWVESIEKKPRKIFLNHGELPALNSLKYRLQTELDLQVQIAEEGVKYVLE